ncbi:tail assembly protein [Achromobacter sp. UMC71]|uniref:tail assembly protein n=1 Tax=Achromobacter sp. UMC71 TaxID=1862320 RepID=UPI001603765B|nr:tail assembly protein [Achromobacter sp. UMC71]MBB1624257.1 phage tail protein [Achromobacter sp. UMC71]
MNDKTRLVRLYGWLGARFGREHRLAVTSPAEAVRALCVLLPGFEKALSDSEQNGVRFACFAGRRNLSEDELRHPVGRDTIRIAPILAGAKNGGVFQTVLGAVLIAVAAFYTGGLAAAFQAGGLVQATATLGLSMMLGGIAQMLSPQQRVLSARDGPENGASYNFNGPVNTTAQGNPVPLLYGEMFVGSATISAGIYSEDHV